MTLCGKSLRSATSPAAFVCEIRELASFKEAKADETWMNRETFASRQALAILNGPST